MNSPFPSLPVPADTIDEKLFLDPIDPAFDEDTLRANTRFLVQAFRAEIAEWNAAQAEAKEKGTKASGSSVKKKTKAKLTELEQKLLLDAQKDGPADLLF